MAMAGPAGPAIVASRGRSGWMDGSAFGGPVAAV